MRKLWILTGLVLAIGISGCSPGLAAVPTETPTATSSPSLEPTQPPPTSTPTLAPTQEIKAVDTPTPRPLPDATDLADETPPRFADREFITDFSKHNVSYEEILSGGPPKDGIPAIDDPQFVTVAEADAWLESLEPVVFFQLGDDPRAYPMQILIWHEIVNDVVAGEPVVVTFCPLCNTAIAFERTFAGEVFDFGTTGRLRFSNLIMYDRQTETWWQQATGNAIAGEHTGGQLTFLPAAIISWDDFKANYPDGKVLSRETGYQRSYGQNPYSGYDNINNSPFLYVGPDHSGRLPPMTRVITIDLNDEAVAYTYDILQDAHVINDVVGADPVVVFWETGTASALDSRDLALGRDVGAVNTFSRFLDGEILTFRYDGENILDEGTASEWDVTGQATAGPLEGKRLSPVVSVNHFWFSWAAFRPDTRIYQPES